MRMSQCYVDDEIAGWVGRTGEVNVFNVTKMYRYASERPYEVECIEIPIEAGRFQKMRQRGLIQESRLNRLCEPYLSRPGLLIVLPEGRDVLIDGHHRYTRRSEFGKTDFCCYRLKPGQWERFVIEDFPVAPVKAFFLTALLRGLATDDRQR
jgi:hypothetical protein